MKVKVLGIGCSNCRTLEDRTREALAVMGVTAEIEKVTDLSDIAGFGLMRLPALVVDDRVVLAGRVPKTVELVALLSDQVGVATTG